MTYIAIVLIISSMCAGFLGGLAYGRNEKNEAYQKGKEDGKENVIKAIKVYTLGKTHEFDEIMKIINDSKGGANEQTRI